MKHTFFGEDEHDFLQLITYHNYTLIELHYQLLADLASGNENRALHIIFEIADSGYVKYAFKLLKRYAAKEVGASDPIAFVLVKSLAEAWEKDKASKANGGEADRHYLALAVQYLARIKKDSATKVLAKQVRDERSARQFFGIDERVQNQAKLYKLREANSEKQPSHY